MRARGQPPGARPLNDLTVDVSDDHIPSQAARVSEVRQRIGSALHHPYSLIRLVHPLRCDVFHDSERVPADVQIVVLIVDPVAEVAAKGALQYVMRGRSINDIVWTEALDLRGSRIPLLP